MAMGPLVPMDAIWRILKMLAREHPKLLLLGYISVFGAAGFALLIPEALGRGIDETLGDSTAGTGALTRLAAVLAFAGIARGLFSFGQTYFAEALAQRVAYDLRNRYFDKLQHLSFSFHDKQATGELMSRATGDIENIRMFVNMGAVRAGFIAATVVGVSAAMLLTDVPMALVSMAFVPFLAWRSAVTSVTLRKTWLRFQQHIARMIAALQENLTGVRVVKAFAAEEHERRKFDGFSRLAADTHFEADSNWARNFAVMNFGFVLSLGAILWFGGKRVLDPGSGFTPGDLTAFFFYMGLMFMPVRMIGWTVNNFARAMSSGQRIFDVLDTPSPVTETPGAAPLERLRGRVTFDRVSFGYQGFGTALHDIDIDVAPGQFVALIGRPGSGKTTFAHLIPRFYDASQGRVLLDGRNVREVTVESIRRNVGVVQQDVFIHTASIRDNIAYGNPGATMTQVERAARIAQLHDFIATLPHGYGTVVGERGVGLSGGQKQRLSIARTILLDPPVLILDDSTSSVDVHTEHEIMAALDAVTRNRTTFLVTNRFAAVTKADFVVVFKGGRIVQRGTHEQLLAEGGEYRLLYDSQMRPYLGEQAQALRQVPNTEAAG